MAPTAAPDLIIPGIEDVVADAQSHGSAGIGEHSMVLNMGPQHPSTHGVLRLVLEIDGEAIVSLAPDIGYLHTGIEKTCEAKFYQQVVPLTDRIDYLCPMTNNLAYCLAVEKLLQLEIPERAQSSASCSTSSPASSPISSGSAPTPWTLARSPSSSTASANAKTSCASSSPSPASA
jgi:NADH-quinone oxidoreductase subunit D